MRGACIIDGVDIDDLGMFILKGGDYDFLTFPSRKTPESNNWYEYDGIDADLSEVFFSEKKITIKFYMRSASGAQHVSRLNALERLLTAPGYRSMYIREYDHTFLLRYLSCDEFRHKGGLARLRPRTELAVEFCMDDPLRLFTGTSPDPIPEYNNNTYVNLSGRDLSQYGIIVQSCYGSVLTIPAVKEPLTRSFNRRNGLLVPETYLNKKEVKQVIISCTMRASSLSVFKRNYEALFNALTQPGEIDLQTFAGSQKCFYTEMRDCKKKHPLRERVLVSFSIVLTALESGEAIFLLAAEDERMIVTEDNINLIDVAYYG